MQSKTLKTRKTIQRIYLTITIFYGFFPIPWQSECKERALHPRERNPFFNILSVKRTEKNKKSLHELNLKFVKYVTQTHLKISDSLHGDIFDQRARSLHSVISCTEYSKAEKVHLHHYT